MSKIRISVIIPTYKPENYIYYNLDKLSQQTIDVATFEVIIVLNGLKEPYYEQLNNYRRQHLGQMNIRILYTEEKGVSNARNIAIDVAQGEYLAFIDDDDWVSKDYLKCLLDNSDELSIIVSDVKAVDETSKGDNPEQYFLTKAYQSCSKKAELSIFDSRSFLSIVWCKIIPRTIIANYRFDKNFTLGEDSIFMFAISKSIKNVKLAPPEAIYFVRLRDNSAMHKHYDYLFRIKLAFWTAGKYTALYIRSPYSYDLRLYLSRIAATFYKLLSSTHR